MHQAAHRSTGILAFIVATLSASLQSAAEPITYPEAGTIKTIVGFGNGDGGPHLDVVFDPRGMAILPNPTLPGLLDVYIADALHHQIRKVTNGTVTSVAGNGTPGYSGDGGPATSAQLNFPMDVAADGFGNLYVADRNNNRIRMIDLDGMITTVAGNGVQRFAGDGGPAIHASLSSPYAVEVDAGGALYIADFINHRVRKVANGVITTVAGNGQSGVLGDSGPATSAQLAHPTDIAVADDGGFYIVSLTKKRIRYVNSNGIITTIAGQGQKPVGPSGVLARESAIGFPFRVALAPSGDLFISETGDTHRVLRFDPHTEQLTVFAGTGFRGNAGDGGPATQATLDPIGGLTVDPNGVLYIASSDGVKRSIRNRIRLIDATNTIHPAIGGGVGDGRPASEALTDPRGSATWTASDGTHYLYTADGQLNRVRRINLSNGMIESVAGTGVAGYFGDGGPASEAQLFHPQDVAASPDGTLYIADRENHVVRCVSPEGMISTFAGQGGGQGSSGDQGLATQARLNAPLGVGLDGAGNVYIADSGNNRVRKVDTAGVISTIAGTGKWGYIGDGELATLAQLAYPSDVVVKQDGRVVIVDFLNSRIRQIELDGTIATIAGGRPIGFRGDGGLATSAEIHFPLKAALDAQDNLYFADAKNARVRFVHAQSGIITTVTGTGIGVDTGDGGPAELASISAPAGVALDEEDHLFIALGPAGRVRVMTVLQTSALPAN